MTPESFNLLLTPFGWGRDGCGSGVVGKGPPLGRSDADWFEYLQIQDLSEVPFMTMDEGVVVAAEKTQVDKHGFAAVGPRNDVMEVTPSLGACAAFPRAVTVPGDHSPA